MNLTEYVIAAERTCKSFGDLEKDLVHMDMGILGEIGEVVDLLKKSYAYGAPIDRPKLTKELGDVCWYAVNRLRFTETEILDKGCLILAMSIEDMFLTLDEYISKERNENLLLNIIKTIATSLGIDFYYILQANIDKLDARYKDGFNPNDATNRSEDDI